MTPPIRAINETPGWASVGVICRVAEEQGGAVGVSQIGERPEEDHREERQAEGEQ
jgi:hypothetical protein